MLSLVEWYRYCGCEFSFSLWYRVMEKSGDREAYSLMHARHDWSNRGESLDQSWLHGLGLGGTCWRVLHKSQWRPGHCLISNLPAWGVIGSSSWWLLWSHCLSAKGIQKVKMIACRGTNEDEYQCTISLCGDLIFPETTGRGSLCRHDILVYKLSKRSAQSCNEATLAVVRAPQSRQDKKVCQTWGREGDDESRAQAWLSRPNPCLRNRKMWFCRRENQRICVITVTSRTATSEKLLEGRWTIRRGAVCKAISIPSSVTASRNLKWQIRWKRCMQFHSLKHEIRASGKEIQCFNGQSYESGNSVSAI